MRAQFHLEHTLRAFHRRWLPLSVFCQFCIPSGLLHVFSIDVVDLIRVELKVSPVRLHAAAEPISAPNRCFKQVL